MFIGQASIRAAGNDLRRLSETLGRFVTGLTPISRKQSRTQLLKAPCTWRPRMSSFRTPFSRRAIHAATCFEPRASDQQRLRETGLPADLADELSFDLCEKFSINGPSVHVAKGAAAEGPAMGGNGESAWRETTFWPHRGFWRIGGVGRGESGAVALVALDRRAAAAADRPSLAHTHTRPLQNFYPDAELVSWR